MLTLPSAQPGSNHFDARPLIPAFMRQEGIRRIRRGLLMMSWNQNQESPGFHAKSRTDIPVSTGITRPGRFRVQSLLVSVRAGLRELSSFQNVDGDDRNGTGQEVW